jgi:predicted membrane protein
MGKIIAGSFLVLLGASILLEQPPFNMWGLNFGNVFSLFWVVIGVILLSRRQFFWGFLFTAFGLTSFVSGFFNIDLGSWFIPLVFIALGLSVMFKTSTSIPNVSKGTNDEDNINETVIFGALEKQYQSKNFKGGKIDCVFAGMKLDLRNIKVDKDGADLEVNAVFGGGEIFVPKDVKVLANGTGVFGGWSNKFESNSKDASGVLRIKGAAVFGGVEVKN